MTDNKVKLELPVTDAEAAEKKIQSLGFSTSNEFIDLTMQSIIENTTEDDEPISAEDTLPVFVSEDLIDRTIVCVRSTGLYDDYTKDDLVKQLGYSIAFMQHGDM